VVHRDLKPGNVFLLQIPGEPDFAKVLDFGISKMKAARTQLTNASAVMGTPNYMSPEQATGMVEDIDHHADQWALACIAWQMLLDAGRSWLTRWPQFCTRSSTWTHIRWRRACQACRRLSKPCCGGR